MLLETFLIIAAMATARVEGPSSALLLPEHCARYHTYSHNSSRRLDIALISR